MLPLPHKLEKIISGGQTGADFGGLLGAKDAGIPTGGWAPKGYRTQNGPMPELARFGLLETASADYPDRTERNVRDADGTVVYDVSPKFSAGSDLTVRLCHQHKKPCLVIKMFSDKDVSDLVDFIDSHNIKVLNVAGNRETNAPGIQEKVRKIVAQAIAELSKRYL